MMDQSTISYAQAPGQHATHSRMGVIAFACAAASVCGITLTMFLLGRPIPGPAGGIIRERVAPVFGAVVVLLWLGGIMLGVAALRQRRHVRTFAAWALVLCGAMALLFLTMILLQY
jgi:heme/copper-type cytochrome/quinol oxidase subunit 3